MLQNSIDHGYYDLDHGPNNTPMYQSYLNTRNAATTHVHAPSYFDRADCFNPRIVTIVVRVRSILISLALYSGYKWLTK